MTQKIAVAVVHGIGKQADSFSTEITAEITKRCKLDCGDDIVIRPVHWSPVMQRAEDELWEQMSSGGRMDFTGLRRFLIDFVADAIAYQPTPHDREAYDDIHKVFAQTLRDLAEVAGPNAPLCIISHSLGTIISSNYIYDLQVDPQRRIIAYDVRQSMGDTPLERGETLTLLYTLGSPIAMWSLRYHHFGRPLQMPPPHLADHYPHLYSEWVNFYDPDDAIGFPIKTLNDNYGRVVAEDRQVDIGNRLESWNPLSHLGYWTDSDVTDPIAKALIRTWKSVNA
ncbi:MAG: hypothetical protein H7175_21460 [Burkholderiales bacterium]|nr:hypothetical protein [Anaerolineae bacterium]